MKEKKVHINSDEAVVAGIYGASIGAAATSIVTKDSSSSEAIRAVLSLTPLALFYAVKTRSRENSEKRMSTNYEQQETEKSK